LYILRDEFTVNPIPDNAEQLRDQAENEGGLCAITIGNYTDDDSFVDEIINSITGDDCSITVCNDTMCDACNSTTCENVEEVTDYRNCDCDLVVSIDAADHQLVLSTVAFKNESTNLINDVKLMGIFDRTLPVKGVENLFGIHVNSPSVPAIVPRFSTMEELTRYMSYVLGNFTKTETLITIEYESSTFILAIEFEKEFEAGVSFSSTVEIGDFAELSVEQSNLSVGGSFLLGSAFAVKLFPNEDESLKFSTTLSEENCTAEGPYNFSITVDGNLTEVELPCVDGTENRIAALNTALINAFGESSSFTVSLAGNSSLVLAFDPTISSVQIVISVSNKYGINNDSQRKKPFHILLGKTNLEANVRISGSATVSARIQDSIEVGADIEAAVGGFLSLSAGTEELIPFNKWLAALKTARDPNDDFHIPNFAAASVTVDGEFAASVEVRQPFELELPLSVKGEFTEPFVLNLLDLNAINLTRPNISLDVDIPKIGDLGDLSFAGERLDENHSICSCSSPTNIFCLVQSLIPIRNREASEAGSRNADRR
jgi:hypothetical protein